MSLNSQKETEALTIALQQNTNGEAVLIDPTDTRFLGVTDYDSDDDIVNTIKSIPCHY